MCAQTGLRLELLFFSNLVLLRSTEAALSGHSGGNSESRQHKAHYYDVCANNGKSNENFVTHILILQGRISYRSQHRLS